MNLLVRKTFGKFNYRKKQYDLILKFIQESFDYLHQFGFPYSTKNLNFEIINDPSYHSNSLNLYDCLIVTKNDNSNSNNNDNKILELFIPKLINDYFFVLNGKYYIPLIYLLDEPISLKKENINIYSLFRNSIVKIDSNQIIFGGLIFNLNEFIHVSVDDPKISNQIIKLFELPKIKNPDLVLEKFQKYFNNDNPNLIIRKLFFDRWTTKLYQRFYEIDEIDFAKIFFYIYRKKNKIISTEFNNLQFKRLYFVELLLHPYLQEITKITNNLLEKQKVEKINLNPKTIISFFQNSIIKNKVVYGLAHRNLYDIVNGFSGLLAFKASFENPLYQSALPSQVKDIHETYKRIVCPITISNDDPGKISNLTPDIRIDTEFGIILTDGDWLC